MPRPSSPQTAKDEATESLLHGTVVPFSSVVFLSFPPPSPFQHSFVVLRFVRLIWPVSSSSRRRQKKEKKEGRGEKESAETPRASCAGRHHLTCTKKSPLLALSMRAVVRCRPASAPFSCAGVCGPAWTRAAPARPHWMARLRHLSLLAASLCCCLVFLLHLGRVRGCAGGAFFWFPGRRPGRAGGGGGPALGARQGLAPKKKRENARRDEE
jgi:hypothetical protein